jgi:hypothetical protein
VLCAARELAEEMILVTNDGADYSAIYRAIDLHPGLVVILPVVKRPIQQSLFRAVVERLVMERDVINKLIEIDEEGAITISEFPPFRDNI